MNVSGSINPVESQTSLLVPLKLEVGYDPISGHNPRAFYGLRADKRLLIEESFADLVLSRTGVSRDLPAARGVAYAPSHEDELSREIKRGNVFDPYELCARLASLILKPFAEFDAHNLFVGDECTVMFSRVFPKFDWRVQAFEVWTNRLPEKCRIFTRPISI